MGSPTAWGLLGDIAKFVILAATSGIGNECGTTIHPGLPRTDFIYTCFPSVILDRAHFHSQIHPNLDDKLYGHPSDKTSGARCLG